MLFFLIYNLDKFILFFVLAQVFYIALIVAEVKGTVASFQFNVMLYTL